MAEEPSLSDLARAMTQLTVLLIATLRLLRWMVIAQTVLILLAFLLLFFLTYQVRAAHTETATLTKALLAQMQALLEQLPPH